MQPYGGVNLRLSSKKMGSHHRVPSDEALMTAHRKYAAHQTSSSQPGSTQQAWKTPPAVPPAAPPAPVGPGESEATPEVGSHELVHLLAFVHCLGHSGERLSRPCEAIRGMRPPTVPGDRQQGLRSCPASRMAYKASSLVRWPALPTSSEQQCKVLVVRRQICLLQPVGLVAIVSPAWLRCMHVDLCCGQCSCF